MTEQLYRRTTRSIEVIVTPTYLADDSEPARDAYMWAYRIRIENHGQETVQLRTRHWRITDAFGRQQFATGPTGIIGYKTKKWIGGVFPQYYWGIGSRGDQGSKPDALHRVPGTELPRKVIAGDEAAKSRMELIGEPAET